MEQQVSIRDEIDIFVEEMFRHEHVRQNTHAHKRFTTEMIKGILGSKSTLIANVARYSKEATDLICTEIRLCSMLRNKLWPREDLQARALDIAARKVHREDVIAFDPGDVTKKYAKKMDNLYPVHDGSTGKIGLGWEDFGVEAIHWENGRKAHTPLYSKLTNAGCEDYVSQNRQIIMAIRAVYDQVGEWCGIWTFDRLHDRTILFKFLLGLNIFWIVRLKFNRSLRFVDGEAKVKVEDLVGLLPLSKEAWWLLFPKRSSELHVAWRKVRFPFHKAEVTLVIVHDPRNEKPVVFLTNMKVTDDLSAIAAFGYYLERWGKEEGYRFSKSFLNLENLRPHRWIGIQNLAFLVHLVYLFISWCHRRHGDELEKLAEERLRNFKPIEAVHFRYYRVAQMMRVRLAEELGHDVATLLNMTEVG
jgi:hypothetical protein